MVEYAAGHSLVLSKMPTSHIMKKLENRGPMRRLLRYVAISPYNWMYTLQLPYYFLRPSIKNHSKLPPLPSSQKLTTDTSALKLVVPGDIMPLKGHQAPIICQPMRDIINSADYFIANCESPIVDQPLNRRYKAMMTFNMPLGYLDNITAKLALTPKQCVFTVANNHSRDCKQQNFDNGISLLKQRGYQVVGQYDPSHPLLCIKHSDLTIGLAAWTHLMNGERVLAPRQVVYRQHHVSAADWQEIKQHYKLNCLIGLHHWGREYQHFSDKATYLAATQLAQQGFDILLGSHSHVIQPAQWLEETFCAFSLANFCSIDTHWRTHLIPLLSLELNTQGQLISYHYDFFMQQLRDGAIHLLPLDACERLTQQRARDILALCFNNVADKLGHKATVAS